MTQPAAIAPVTQLSTIDPTPEAAPAPATEAAPPAPTGADVASGAADPPVAPPAEDTNLALSRRLETIAKREAKARRLETEAAERIAALTETETKAKERLAELEAALDDPIDYYLKKGKDPVEVAQRFAKPVTPEEKRIMALEAKIAANEAAETKRQEEREAAHNETWKNEVTRRFVSTITPDNCPNITTLYDAHEVPGLTSALLNRVDPRARDEDGNPDRRTLLQRFKGEHGRAPTDEEIRDCLEHEAGIRATKILKARSAAQPVTAAPQRSPDESGSGPATIGNQHGSAAAAPKRRPLSLEERRKASRDQLVRDLEAEAASRKSD